MGWTSELALTEDLIVKINAGKEVVYIPNFTEIKQETDFNFLAEILERHELGSEFKSPAFRPHGAGGILSTQLQVRNVEKDLFFETYLKVFNKIFNPDNKYSDIHLHLTFMALSGASHQDWEHVYIIGLYGHTIYRVFGDKDYSIRKGDFIYIPPKKCHKAIAMEPRIIMSMGIEK
jgi:mannose-6-phosphate isomerase-like protein (cupin superfamily)